MFGAEGTTASATAGNAVSGSVHGHVVQARDIRQIVQVFDSGGARVVPAQLPPVPRSFTSRARELAHLGRWHVGDGESSLLVVLHGVGGVGKTTLALRWLHDLGREFPDGTLYADLGAFSTDKPVSSDDALEWFLIALGVRPDHIPVELAARTGLYRSVVAGRSVAVLLDNALSAAQVRPLLPAGGPSVVVVTSRLRLAGLGMDGARFVEVDPMDVDSSVALLANVVDDRRLADEPGAAREVALLCGGLPIALSVVGARLSARPRRTLSREATALRAERQRLSALSIEGEQSVEISFDLSYRELPAAAARLYRLCSLHPAGDFGVEVAAAGADLPVDEAEGLLDLLVDANLLREVDDRSFAFHDLLRLHALGQSDREDPPAAQAAAVRRLVELYLDVVVSADAVLHPHRRRVGPRYENPRQRFDTDVEALTWLTAHRATLRWALEQATRQRWDDVVWQFCEAMWGFFLHTRRYEEWIAANIEGVEAARRCRAPLAEARLRTQLGFSYAKSHRYQESIAQSTEALRLSEGLGDERAIATALSQLGRAARGNGDPASALDYFTRARDIQERLGERRYAAMYQRRIGQILTELGRYDDAVRELTAAAATMKAVGDRTQHARALMYLGITGVRSSRPESAAQPLHEALDLMRELGSAYYRAEILTAMGELAEQTGDLSTARRSYAKAAELYGGVEDPRADGVRSRLSELPETNTE
jgi:tetratricopeptide (TPR) repeat protein